MFAALKAPIVLKSFFENELSEMYILHLQSFVSIFDAEVKRIEKDKNSLLEVKACLQRMTDLITARREASFRSKNVKSLLGQLQENGVNVDRFLGNVDTLYIACAEYLEKWSSQFLEFDCFPRMLLSKKPSWSEIEEFLNSLGR